MKKFLAALLIGLSLVSITLDASAARLGGGASFGRSMSVPKAAPSSPFKAPSAAATKRPATAAAAGAAAKAPMSMGKRLLIGAAAALGFMALANMLGLGEGFAQMLMILTLILLAVVAFRFFAARKSGASAASAGAPAAQPTQDADFGQSRSEAAVREQPAFILIEFVRIIKKKMVSPIYSNYLLFYQNQGAFYPGHFSFIKSSILSNSSLYWAASMNSSFLAASCISLRVRSILFSS